MSKELEKKIHKLRKKIDLHEVDYGKKRVKPISILADLLSGIIVGSLLGYWVDSYFKTLPLFLFIFSIFGIVAGIYNVYKESMVFEKKDDNSN